MKKILYLLCSFTLLMGFNSCKTMTPDENQLLTASQTGDLNTVKSQVAKGTNVNTQRAFRFMFDPALKGLTHGTAEYNRVKDTKGFTPLMFACREGRTEIVQFLVANGANVNIEESDGWRALHFAAHNNRLDIVRILLNNKADIQAYDDEGYAALHLAAANGHVEMATLLLQGGANINAKERWAITPTPLWVAAKKGRVSMVEFLLMNGARAKIDDTLGGVSAIEIAAQEGNYNTVRLLIEAGSKRKDDALEAADRSGHREIAQLLTSHGANLSFFYKLDKTMDGINTVITETAQELHRQAKICPICGKSSIEQRPYANSYNMYSYCTSCGYNTATYY